MRIVSVVVIAAVVIAVLVGCKKRDVRVRMVEGQVYWLEASTRDPGVVGGIVIYSLPQADPPSSMVTIWTEYSEVRLVGREGEWCYVALMPWADHPAGGPTPVVSLEGWTRCEQLQSLPIPTLGPLVLTPQRPGAD